jgi:hypothetical protein
MPCPSESARRTHQGAAGSLLGDCPAGSVRGTSWQGALGNDDFRRALLPGATPQARIVFGAPTIPTRSRD